MKTFLFLLGVSALMGVIVLDDYVNHTSDCCQQFSECQEQVAKLDSTLKTQTEYYRNFYWVAKTALPGDTVIMIIH